MGNSTKIVTSRGKRRVPSRPLIRGLVFHTSIANPTHFAITHADSGLAIIDGLIDKIALRDVRDVLIQVMWTGTEQDIYQSDDHLSCIEEAVTVAKNYRKSFSEKRETKIAKELKGKVQPASGAGRHHKRDVLLPKVMIEHKTTTPGKPKRFSLQDADLEYLRLQAYDRDRVPVYIIEFAGEDGVVFTPEDDIEGVLGAIGVAVYDHDSSDKKSLLVNPKLAAHLTATQYVRVKMKSRSWIGFGYFEFLKMVKS